MLLTAGIQTCQNLFIEILITGTVHCGDVVSVALKMKVKNNACLKSVLSCLIDTKTKHLTED